MIAELRKAAYPKGDSAIFGNPTQTGRVLDRRLDFDIEIRGSTGEDRIVGLEFSGTIAGAGGNDLFRGLGGRDELVGGPGHDQLRGGHGNDTLKGGGDNDLLWGGNGHEMLIGGSRNDVLRGEHGRGILNGRTGDGVPIGAANNDHFLFEDSLADTDGDVERILGFVILHIHHDRIDLRGVQGLEGLTIEKLGNRKARLTLSNGEEGEAELSQVINVRVQDTPTMNQLLDSFYIGDNFGQDVVLVVDGVDSISAEAWANALRACRARFSWGRSRDAPTGGLGLERMSSLNPPFRPTAPCRLIDPAPIERHADA